MRLHSSRERRAGAVKPGGGEQAHRGEPLCRPDSIGYGRVDVHQVVADQLELIGDQRLVVCELDQREHEPQIDGDRLWRA